MYTCKYRYTLRSQTSRSHFHWQFKLFYLNNWRKQNFTSTSKYLWYSLLYAFAQIKEHFINNNLTQNFWWTLSWEIQKLYVVFQTNILNWFILLYIGLRFTKLHRLWVDPWSSLSNFSRRFQYYSFSLQR